MAFILSSKEITNESVISLQGDMPRYIMNGVYFHDLIMDMPIFSILEYTYKYYCKYPALSLGHHQLLVSIAGVPFYYILGISIFSAKIAVIVFFIVASIFLFKTIELIYDERTALFSSLLFLTTPYIVKSSRVVMSEMSALALLIMTVYYFFKYCRYEDKKSIILFTIFLCMSIYAKIISIFIIPVFIIYFVFEKKISKIFTRNVVLSMVIFSVLVFPLLLLTVKFSKSNIGWVVSSSVQNKLDLHNTVYHLNAIWQYHITIPNAIISFISIVISMYYKNKKNVFFYLWLIFLYIQATLVTLNMPRISLYWIPVFCFFSANTINYPRNAFLKKILSILLLSLVCFQFIKSFRLTNEYADGYEDAAKYITENRKGRSLLYSADVDTGYFTFFVRKHDHNRNTIILLADKMLVTSKLGWIVEERINSREEIYDILKDFGIGYVVMEDKEFKSPPLEWLRQEVNSDKFVLHRRIPIRSNDHRLKGVSLAIYEYKEYTPPKPGKILHINVPLMGDSIRIKFDDLLDNKFATPVTPTR